jgi:hypothetical protein
VHGLITAAPELITSAPELITPKSPAPRRKRDRRRTLTRIDQRSRLGKRIRELVNLFTGATGGDPSPVMKMRIAQAAQLSATAEQARGDHMRGHGTGDIVRLERAAATAVRALGELEAKPRERSIFAQLADAARWRFGSVNPGPRRLRQSAIGRNAHQVATTCSRGVSASASRAFAASRT